MLVPKPQREHGKLPNKASIINIIVSYACMKNTVEPSVPLYSIHGVYLPKYAFYFGAAPKIMA